MDFLTLFKYLIEQIPELEFGRNLFINSLPTDLGGERVQVLFRDTYSGIQIDDYIEDYRYGRVAMSVRGYDYTETRDFARQIGKVLTIANLIIDDTEIKHMRPLAEPVGFMNSEGGYNEFMTNFYVVYGLEVTEPVNPEEPENPSEPEGGSSEDTSNG